MTDFSVDDDIVYFSSVLEDDYLLSIAIHQDIDVMSIDIIRPNTLYNDRLAYNRYGVRRLTFPMAVKSIVQVLKQYNYIEDLFEDDWLRYLSGVEIYEDENHFTMNFNPHSTDSWMSFFSKQDRKASILKVE